MQRCRGRPSIQKIFLHVQHSNIELLMIKVKLNDIRRIQTSTSCNFMQEMMELYTPMHFKHANGQAK